MKLIMLLVLSLFIGCGTSVVPPPEAGTVFLSVPEDAPVYYDGLLIGTGPRTVTILLNWPNYIQVGSWRVVLWSAGGLDSLAFRGDPGVDVDYMPPSRIEVKR